MDFSRVLDSIKLSPKYLFAIFVAGCLFLFAPASILGRMSLNDFWLRPYIGIATLLSAALLVTHGVSSVIDWLKRRRATRRELESWQKSLQALTPSEKQVLIPYILGNENSAYFNISDGVAGGLEAKKILYRASNIGPMGNFPYNLQPWAREHLKAHPELLD